MEEKKEKSGSSIWRRLRIYAVGVGLGCLISWGFFKGRGCTDWTPSHRVTELLTQNVLIANDTVLAKMKTNKIEIGDIVQLIQNGEVNFSKSKTDESPQIYVLEGTNVIDEPYSASFSVNKDEGKFLHDTISYLIGVTGRDAISSTSENKVIHLSDKMKSKIVNMDSKLAFMNDTPQQVKALNLSTDSIQRYIGNGTLNVGLSDPDLLPNALFVFSCLIQKEELRVSFTKNGDVIEVQDIRRGK
jgi:hypothetical protein